MTKGKHITVHFEKNEFIWTVFEPLLYYCWNFVCNQQAVFHRCYQPEIRTTRTLGGKKKPTTMELHLFFIKTVIHNNSGIHKHVTHVIQSNENAVHNQPTAVTIACRYPNGSKLNCTKHSCCVVLVILQNFWLPVVLLWIEAWVVFPESISLSVTYHNLLCQRASPLH